MNVKTILSGLNKFEKKILTKYKRLNDDKKLNELKDALIVIKEEIQSLATEVDKSNKDTESELNKSSNSLGFNLPSEVKSKNDFALFSDGACRGNPGPGSYGVLIQDFSASTVHEESKSFEQTTNNRMEMLGALKALEYFDKIDGASDLNLFLYSDSKYLVNGMNSWVQGWKKRGWKKADKREPENLDLWKKLDEKKSQYNIEFIWVKGHAGHPQNEYCDKLANLSLDQFLV